MEYRRAVAAPATHRTFQSIAVINNAGQVAVEARADAPDLADPERQMITVATGGATAVAVARGQGVASDPDTTIGLPGQQDINSAGTVGLLVDFAGPGVTTATKSGFVIVDAGGM